MGCTSLEDHIVIPKGPFIFTKRPNTHADVDVQLTVVSIVNYAVGCMAVKATLLALYLRVFSPNPQAKALIWLRLIFNGVFYTISVIVDLTACLPHPGDEGWSAARPNRCETENVVKFAEAHGVIGAITDLYVFFIPMTMLAGLHLSRKHKIGLYCVSFTGFLRVFTNSMQGFFDAKTSKGLRCVDHQCCLPLQDVPNR